jgi:hypothetical protein
MLEPIERIYQMAAFSYEISRLTDEQIADLLMERVWGDMVASSEESEIVSAAMDRLRRAGGGPTKWEVAKVPDGAEGRAA